MRKNGLINKKVVKIKETPKGKEKGYKEENGLDLASRISGHPKMLGAYTPRVYTMHYRMRDMRQNL